MLRLKPFEEAERDEQHIDALLGQDRGAFKDIRFRRCFKTVATFARTWANPRQSHVLANMATTDTGFETPAEPVTQRAILQVGQQVVGRQRSRFQALLQRDARLDVWWSFPLRSEQR